jgi:putative phosphoesterase
MFSVEPDKMISGWTVSILEIEKISELPQIVVGVVADTHVPDLADSLHPALIPALRIEGVHLIIHAGDICAPPVIRFLEEIAPVIAVRGNRDLLFSSRLPLFRSIHLAGVPIVLMHGHGTWYHYLLDKLRNFFEGYRESRYIPRLAKPFPEAKAIIFGHTHYPVNLWHGGKLFFNPGSTVNRMGFKLQPSFGILNISKAGEVRGKHLVLEGEVLHKRRWIGSIPNKP